MKKLIAFFYAFLLVLTLAAYSTGEYKVFNYPFVGHWQPAEEPVLADEHGIQDIQNLRKDGKRFKGVGGHTLINSAAIGTYTYIINGFHFLKDQPAESHVIIYAANSITPTAGRLYENTTAVPAAGNFTTATALHTPSYYNAPWRFANAPQGNMIAANGDETLIWGGNEIEATAVITSSTTVTYSASSPNDYSDVLSNSSQASGQTATLSAEGGNDSYVSLLLHGDGTDGSAVFTDAGPNNLVVSYNGNSQIDTAQSKFGGAAILLDGSSDNITVASTYSAYFEFADGNFTIDFWVRFNADPDGSIVYFARHYNNASNYWRFYKAATDKLYLQAVSGGVTVADFVTTGTVNFNTGTWYHVAVVRSGANCFMYVQGESQAVTETTAFGTFSSADGSLYIGSDEANANNVNGWLDEFRISKGSARWVATFTPPTIAYGVKSSWFLIGTKRPIQGVKFYVSTGNTASSTMIGQYWSGGEWTNLALTDNTDTGATLAQTGTVTFSSTVGTAKPRYINGLSLYWYQFSFNAGSATLYYVTVDAPVQSVPNIWNGTEQYPVSFMKNNGTTFLDYTDNVSDEDLSTSADVSSLTANAHYLVAGFVEPMQGFNVKMVVSSENSTASTTMTVASWNGGAWQNVGAFYDGTNAGGISLARGGYVSWQGAGTGSEYQRTISNEVPLYYYKITFSQNLDADCKIAEVTGIPYPAEVKKHTFASTYQGRTFLCNERSGAKNRCIYSAYDTPDIFNGADSGELTFGNKTELTAAAVVYNVFRTEGFEQLIVTKKNETYRLSGDSPQNWQLQRMSENVGCVAPLSMAVCDVTDLSPGQDSRRHVAVWMGDKGVYLSDGALIVPISDDIKVYWDENDSRAIPAAMMSKAVGWFDPKTRSYKLLISSGTAGYLNTELEYSLKHREWTKLYRENTAGANPLQSGWQVRDTSGVAYTYGGGKDGYVYRLENGYTWNGRPIAQHIRTKDLLLSGELLLKTTVDYVRLAYKKKAVTSAESVAVTHYNDQVVTTHGTAGQYVPAAMAMSAAPYATSAVRLGPALYHSFVITGTTSTVADGMELVGMSLFFTPSQTIDE